MSEQWKSYAKHYCKICQIWLSGHARNVLTHEQSDRHKQNEERHVLRLKKTRLAEEALNDRVQKELRRINQIVTGPYSGSAPTASVNKGGNSTTPKAHEQEQNGNIAPHIPPAASFDMKPTEFVPDGLGGKYKPKDEFDPNEYKPVYKFNLPDTRKGAGDKIRDKLQNEFGGGSGRDDGASIEVTGIGIGPGNAPVVADEIGPDGGDGRRYYSALAGKFDVNKNSKSVALKDDVESSQEGDSKELDIEDKSVRQKDDNIGQPGAWEECSVEDRGSEHREDRIQTTVDGSHDVLLAASSGARIQGGGRAEREGFSLKSRAPKAVNLDPNVKLAFLEEKDPGAAMRYRLELATNNEKTKILQEQQYLGSELISGDYGHLSAADLTARSRDIAVDVDECNIKEEEGALKGSLFKKRKKNTATIKKEIKIELKKE